MDEREGRTKNGAAASPDYLRVEKAIRFLEDRRPDQPTLAEVADHVGVSPSHLHRTFRRWAGVTPKRFLQYLTVEHARALLEASRPVLETAYETGLSGGGRLHDHFVQVEAVTPGQVQSGGRGLVIRTGVHPSPFGPALLGATDRGVCFLAFLEPGNEGAAADPVPRPRSGPDALVSVTGEEALDDLRRRWPEAEVRHDPEATAPLARRAFAPLGDDDVEVPLPLHLRGTNFQIQVWRALLRIPEGRLTTYGDLARLLERPDAARAVGSAVGANPVAYLIPCHRVIRSTGEFGAYRWGGARKRAMLGRETGGCSPGGRGDPADLAKRPPVPGVVSPRRPRPGAP